MAGTKVTKTVLKRLRELRGMGLTQELIAMRLGITSRTVRFYLNVYKEPVKIEAPDVRA